MLLLFITGTVLEIIGWFFDKAANISWIMKFVCRNTYFGLKALDLLAQNTNGVLLPQHPGFDPIVRHWPQLADKNSVQSIGRGPAFIKFGAQAEPGFALIAYQGEIKIDSVWEEASARKILLSEQDLKLFRYGALLFYLGLIVSIISGLFGLLNR